MMLTLSEDLHEKLVVYLGSRRYHDVIELVPLLTTLEKTEEGYPIKVADLQKIVDYLQYKCAYAEVVRLIATITKLEGT